MPTPDEPNAPLAILIDADNANPAIVKGLIDGRQVRPRHDVVAREHARIRIEHRQRDASHLKESGKRVYGFGEKKTPRPFVAACDRFMAIRIPLSCVGTRNYLTSIPAAQCKAQTGNIVKYTTHNFFTL